jgi:putative transposase
LAGVTANPNGDWVTQQARNVLLVLVLGEQGRRVCFLLHDRDAKSSRGFDDVFCSEAARCSHASAGATSNADAER